MPQLDCQRTVYSFNVLLKSCIRSERDDEIGLLFRELREKLSIVPNLTSYNLAMKALCKAGFVYSAVLLMDKIEKHGGLIHC
uniref:Pentacotripeptide-repeat region of PRORP domain-containing protein n=1 Tax=Solanum lycopersicum TaxID=4081 RepID=A0A3Q7H4X9_SOLLC